MQALALFVSAALLLLAAPSIANTGDPFDLSDAVEDLEPTKKPTPPSKGSPVDEDLNLEDALGGGEANKPDTPQTKPGTHEDTGGISDADLIEGGVPPADPPAGPGAGEHGSGSPEKTEGSQGMLAGIISSVVVAIAGAVSSFIAYQKKKLCFKQGDQENVNMESQQGVHAEPPVQRTLLQKS